MKLWFLLILPLAGCQTVGLPIDVTFPPVPQDVVACARRANVALPSKDLTAAETETAWKQDRLTNVVLRRCLNRLIIRDQKLAGGKE